jgi:hypothetical protein
MKNALDFVTLLKSMLTLPSCLDPKDTDIHLLQTHAAAKLLHVMGTAEPGSLMCWDLPRGASPVMLPKPLNLPLDPNMHITKTL